MIDAEEYLKVPDCKLCKGNGSYLVRILTAEQSDEYGVEIGGAIQAKCGECRRQKIRRKTFLDHKNFQKQLMLFEMSDYEIPDNLSNEKILPTRAAVEKISTMLKDLETSLYGFGGFVLLMGPTCTGKSIVGHILARESYAIGRYAQLISIHDLVIDLSYLRSGTVAKNEDGEIVFDLADYIKPDLLIVDHFDDINQFFNRSDLRRALLLKIFSERLKQEKPTVIISKVNITDMFSSTVREVSAIPYDFPVIINKKFIKLELYGKFKKR